MTKYICIKEFSTFQINKAYIVYDDILEQEYFNNILNPLGDVCINDVCINDDGIRIVRINKDVFNKNFVTEQQYRKMKLTRLNILSQN